MKYSLDTYRMYQSEAVITHGVRVSVVMKEPVDYEILKRSVNTAIKRYPYFAVKVAVDEEGGYILKPNHEPVAVLHARKNPPKLGSKEVNGHLLFVDCGGKEISFFISHSMCGGRGFLPWVMTSVYQYVVDRYNVVPNAPDIRKPDSNLLPGESAELSLDSLTKEPPIYRFRSKKPVVMLKDYINGFINPFVRKPNYRLYSFEQKDLVSFIKNNDSSIASFFLVVVAKALGKVLPEKDKVIGGEIAHNPTALLGIPNTHCDILSHVHIDYDREQLKWDMERLGTMTRGQMILQTDPTVSSDELRRLFTLYDKLDNIKGLRQKRKFISKNSPSTGKDANHGTYIVNYTGQMNWGEVADYVESYVIVTEGHLLLEITSIADRIHVSFMQLLDESKYAEAFEAVFDELNIPYKVEGPFEKRLSKHDIPRR